MLQRPIRDPVAGLNMYHAPIIKPYYRMDTSEASTGYELTRGMESILRNHSIELLLDRYALLMRVSNKEGLDRGGSVLR